MDLPKKNIFKLIAIQPLDCAQCILKNLKNGDIYYFYKGYSIKDDQITFEESLMNDDFFNIDNSKLNISIHTIVGKNGSGKSAIVELLMRVLNNIAYILHDKEKDPLTTIYPVDDLEANLFFQINDSIYKVRLDKLVDERDVTAICKKLNSKEIEYNIKNNEEKFLRDFFYSIVINYSIYAYNGNDFGIEEKFDSIESKPKGLRKDLGISVGNTIWIDGVMHKNDGYSAPLVIHPQRKNGDIDINNEKHLTISRLLSLFVNLGNEENTLKVFNEKNEISKIVFYLKNEELFLKPKSKNAAILRLYFRNIQNSSIFSSDITEKDEVFEMFKESCVIIFKKWIDIAKLKIEEKEITFDLINNNLEYNYLVYKTMTIINKYWRFIIPKTQYIYFFSGDYSLTNLNGIILENEIENHIKAIFLDNSHIILKLKQTLNYINFTKAVYNNNKEIIISENYFPEKIEIIDFKPFEFSIQLNKFKNNWGDKSSDILNFMPPPFIKPIIKYKNIETQNEHKNEYPFDYLSSGEKQYIFFITTVLYHLRNIESAHKTRTNRIKYENVNLIFEEIELYFHPEMQRRLIHDILISLKNMHYHLIKNINICLVTHSPIILSDIPTSNGLFLKDGKQEDMIEQTFASNIYSLFRNAFFLEGAPIGEFAVNKIKNLCDKIENLCANIENKYISDSSLLKEINQIGDPIIRNQIKKKYDEYKKNQRIIELTNENKLLKKQLNDKNI